jgi:hypothetical protein
MFVTDGKSFLFVEIHRRMLGSPSLLKTLFDLVKDGTVGRRAQHPKAALALAKPSNKLPSKVSLPGKRTTQNCD